MYYTTSTAFLEALAEAGVRYIFANLGSDHPGIIEALAQAKTDGRARNLPELIVCPHETVALSAAHAYASVTRQPQAVLVHVDAGTQNLGGAVNNAMRGRVPVLIFAGAAPYTIQYELPAGRNEFIHWIQDVHDQRGILRNYVKYDNEIRTGRNVKQLVHRAMQISRSEPCGPVYLVGPREVMEERVEPYDGYPERYPSIGPAALTADVSKEIAEALAAAERPLIITSYLGRNPEAVPELVALADLLAIPVLESCAVCMNFPAHHAAAEPAARIRRRDPGCGQRRAVDLCQQPAARGRGDLRDRHRPAEGGHVHVAYPRAPLRHGRLQGCPGTNPRRRSNKRPACG
jgi:acetolactate synthase-1/2/3 large subunit